MIGDKNYLFNFPPHLLRTIFTNLPLSNFWRNSGEPVRVMAVIKWLVVVIITVLLNTY